MNSSNTQQKSPGGPHASEIGRSSKAARRVRRLNGLVGYLFLLPWMVGILLITAIPAIASLGLSFTDYDLFTSPNFIGIDNYLRMFSDPRIGASLGVTFTYVLVGVPLTLAVALLMAVLLDRGIRGVAFYRSAFYLPSLIGSSVAIAILWKQLFGSDGLLNQALEVFGIKGMSWVSNPDTALGTLVVLSMWTFGSSMVIFLAGLRQIPRMYYEAAEVDGATKLQRFTRITLPLLSPIIFFNLVLGIITHFQAFTQAFVVSGGTGGPSDSTLFFTLYLYQKGFGGFDMGYASAMAWLMFAIIGAFTAINFLGAKYWVVYDD